MPTLYQCFDFLSQNLCPPLYMRLLCTKKAFFLQVQQVIIILKCFQIIAYEYSSIIVLIGLFSGVSLITLIRQMSYRYV